MHHPLAVPYDDQTAEEARHAKAYRRFATKILFISIAISLAGLVLIAYIVAWRK